MKIRFIYFNAAFFGSLLVGLVFCGCDSGSRPTSSPPLTLDTAPGPRSSQAAQNDFSAEEPYNSPEPLYTLSDGEIVDYLPDERMFDRNFYIILDTSSSMASPACGEGKYKDRFQGAVAAIKTFLNNVKPDDNVGLSFFEKQVAPLGQDNRERIVQSLEEETPNGATPLQKAIIHGVDVLYEQSKRQKGCGDYFLVVVSDGQSSDGDVKPACEYALEKRIPIVAIGLCFKDASALTQSKYATYTSAASVAQLEQALLEVAAEVEVEGLN